MTLADDPASSSQTRAIAAALARLVDRHPDLAPLLALLPATLDITPAFVAAYDASPVTYGRRSLLLRLLFAEPLAGLDPSHRRVTRALLQRAVQWWQARGALSGDAVPREVKSKALEQVLGASRDAFETTVRQTVMEPLWRLRTHGDTGWPAYAGLSADDLAPLQTVFDARRLTRRDAEALLDVEANRAAYRATWFFDTACAPLDLRNALICLAALFDRDRKGGRIQNLLPGAWSSRWGLKRLSVPVALAFCDVAQLAIDGLIDLPRGDADVLGLADAVAPAARPVLAAPDDADMQWALQQHRSRWRVDVAFAQQRERLRSTGQRGGMYDTSFAFNVPRMLITRDAQEAGLAPLLPYYAAANPERLLDACAPTWRAADPAIETTIRAWWHAHRDEPPMRVRDLGNILALLAHVDVDDPRRAWRFLPSVARYALGLPEPVPGGRPGKGRRRRPGPSDGTPRDVTLPLLDELWRPRARAYLLTPDYAGPVPTDAQVFVHAADAAGRVLPPGVRVVGSTPLAWGQDAEGSARAALHAVGFRVERLQTVTAAANLCAACPLRTLPASDTQAPE